MRWLSLLVILLVSTVQAGELTEFLQTSLLILFLTPYGWVISLVLIIAFIKLLIHIAVNLGKPEPTREQSRARLMDELEDRHD